MDHQQGNNNEQAQGMGPAGSDPIPYGMEPSGSNPTPYGMGLSGSDPTPYSMGSSGSDPTPYGMGPSGSDPIPYGMHPYQANQMMGPTTPSSVGPIHSPQIAGPPSSPGQLTQQQLAYQHIQKQQHQLQQLLQGFWAKQLQDVENTTDFKNHSLPLARIKKIMKADEDVRMISAEAPVIFARACEMFILELTVRAWNHTEENKRRTLQKNDISAAITKTDIFDFLVDIIPREDMGENVLATPIPRAPFPLPTPGYPYYYMPQQPPVGLPGMFVGKPMDQGFYAGPQQHAYFAQQQIWPQIEQEEEQEEEQQQDQEQEQQQQQPSDES